MLIYLTLLTLKKIFRSGASNERDLIKKIAKHNLKALEALYDRYAEIVYSFILAIVHEQKVAAKLTRNIFLLIWQKSASFNTKSGNVYRWLFSLTRKTVLKSRSTANKNTALTNISISGELNLNENKKSKLDAAKVCKQSKTVKKVFKKLPDEEQEVIRLAYYNGMTQHEIAGLLNIPVYDVKKYMRDGMTAIVASLNDS